MSIEVKQMLVTSSVLRDSENETGTEAQDTDLDEIIAQIREECRQLVIEMLRRERER